MCSSEKRYEATSATSSASRPWRAPRSSGATTATVAMPRARQARKTRKAISPRLRTDKLRLLADIDGLAGALGKLERTHATKAPETLPGASQLTQIASDV